MKTIIILATIVTTLCVTGGSAQTSSGNSTQSNSTPAPTASKLTTADLKKLRWIEGTWRGTGDGQTPFYERYKFVNDSTLTVETLENEKLDKVKDVARFELKDSQFGGGSQGSRYVATAIDDKSITFDPVTKARNSFRWERENEDSWKAVLFLPANDKEPAKEITYKMERWPPVSIN